MATSDAIDFLNGMVDSQGACWLQQYPSFSCSQTRIGAVMLTEAIFVVEAVRALNPRQAPAVPGMWRFSCEPRHMTRLMRELGEALEQFDAAAGSRRSPAAMLVKAIQFGEERGIPAGEMIAALQDEDLRDAESLSELKPQPGEIGPPDKVSDSSPVPAPAPRFGDPDAADLAPKDMAAELPDPVPALVPAAILKARPTVVPVITRQRSSSSPLQGYVDEMNLDVNIALADAGDYAADAGLEMDAIGDRLAYVLGKYGLTPKLRILLAAFIRARNRASMDMEGPGGVSMQDAGTLARVSADIKAIEMNPSLAWPPGYEDELKEEMRPPMPSPRLRPHR